MAQPKQYTTGTVALSTGATALVGTGTAWLSSIKADDIFAHGGYSVRIASVTDDANIVLAENWPAAAGNLSAATYEIRITRDGTEIQLATRQLLDLITEVENTGIGIDAFGLKASRTTYDAKYLNADGRPFAYLSTNGDGVSITTPVVYIKNSAVSADWSAAISVVGPTGPAGATGLAGAWRGQWVTAHAYILNDIVYQLGSSYICLVAHTSGTFATDLGAGKWQLATSKGDHGEPGLNYTFSTTTGDADPGNGILRLNNATIASATAAYIDNLDGDGATVTAILDTWDDSTNAVRGVLTIRSLSTPATYAQFSVTGSVVDGTGYRKLTLAYLAGHGALSNAEAIAIAFARTGNDGTNGVVPGLRYIYSSTTTDSDPGPGNFRFNNATIASATGAFLDNVDSDGATVTSILDTWDDSTATIKGTLTVRSSGTPATYAQFSVTGSVVDGTGYRKLTLAYLAGNGALSNTDPISVQFSRTGNNGAVSAVSSSAQARAGTDDTTALSPLKGVQNSGVFSRVSPQGRLTLATGVPVITADVPGATTVYYTPYCGDLCPIYDGTAFVPTVFTELSQALSDATKSPAAAVPEAVYDKFVWNDGGTVRCTRGPSFLAAATITVTIATPAVVTWTAHGLPEGAPVVFTNSGGALPTGITAGTVYYVGRSPATNTFNISTTRANAAAGTFVATTGSQSGTHTGTNRTTARGSGAGTTELQRINGVLTNKNAITNGPGANQGTYVGTIYVNASTQVDMKFGAHSSGGGQEAVLGVWNMYNRRGISSSVSDSTSTWPYTSATKRPMNGSASNRVTYVCGIVEDQINTLLTATMRGVGASTFMDFGLGHDSTNGISGHLIEPFWSGAAIAGIFSSADKWVPGLGLHFLQMVEGGDGTNANVVVGSGAASPMTFNWQN